MLLLAGIGHKVMDINFCLEIAQKAHVRHKFDGTPFIHLHWSIADSHLLRLFHMRDSVLVLNLRVSADPEILMPGEERIPRLPGVRMLSLTVSKPKTGPGRNLHRILVSIYTIPSHHSNPPLFHKHADFYTSQRTPPAISSHRKNKAA